MATKLTVSKESESINKIPFEKKRQYIQYLRENPVIACKELLNVELAPHERIMLKGMWENKWILNILGRGCGKCAAEDQLIYNADLNKFISHKEAYLQYKAAHKFNTLARNEDNQLIKTEAKIFDNGKKECVEIKTNNGRSIIVTYNHPLLVKKVDNGKIKYDWIEAKDLNIGNEVAVVGKLPSGKINKSANKVKLAGQLIGIKNNEDAIPEEAYAWNNNTLSNFLGGLFDSCGSFNDKETEACYYLSNEETLKALQRLLLRFGIISEVKKGALCIEGNPYIELFKCRIKIDLCTPDYDFVTVSEAEKNMPDIVWESISSISYAGYRNTYGVEVPNFNNYLVDTFVTHNTFMNAVFGALRCLLFSGEKIVIVGPSFRQSIFVFNEMEQKLLANSPYFQQALIDKPKHSTSDYSMVFKNGSTITALPLGVDGSKIRGTRATVIIVDEAAQVPADIIDQAIIPFMSTRKNPMAQYLGVKEEDSQNALVFSSSAYYQFNHIYQKYVYWLQQIESGAKNYFVAKFNYEDTPEGFCDLEVVEMQRRTSPEDVFAMEYLAEFPKDSLGFFPASLVQKCVDRFVAPLAKGKKNRQYILGLDPARSDDNFGIVVLELLGDVRNVVLVEAHKNKSLPEMKERICEILENFNIVRIGCDRFGGGSALADLLKEGHKYVSKKTGKLVSIPPILVINDKDTELIHGNRILELITFSSSTISEMNFDLKARMENGLLRIPASPYETNEVVEEAEMIFEEIVQLRTELTSIEVEKTTSDYLKFIAPTGQKKDRYSALLIANHAADHYLSSGVELPELPVGFWGGV